MALTPPIPSTPELIGPAEGIGLILTADPNFNLPDNSWAINYSRLEDSPDCQLVIRDTGGPSGEIAVAVDYPGVQLLCRGPSASGSYKMVRGVLVAARNSLVGIPTAPSAWPNLIMCVARGDIQSLGYDSSSRPVFSLNLQLTVAYEVSGYRVL